MEDRRPTEGRVGTADAKTPPPLDEAGSVRLPTCARADRAAPPGCSRCSCNLFVCRALKSPEPPLPPRGTSRFLRGICAARWSESVAARSRLWTAPRARLLIPAARPINRHRPRRRLPSRVRGVHEVTPTCAGQRPIQVSGGLNQHGTPYPSCGIATNNQCRAKVSALEMRPVAPVCPDPHPSARPAARSATGARSVG